LRFELRSAFFADLIIGIVAPLYCKKAKSAICTAVCAKWPKDTYHRGMIRHIRGKVLSATLGSLVIEAGGIGYEVRVATTASIVAREGDEVSLHTYFAVRETSQDLYGFPTLRERAMFEMLIDLPGIGPKSALGIMSQADVRLIEEAAQKNDAVYLSKLSGIGKKSAEKIVAGLKDKVEGVEESSSTTEDNDVIDGLIALGYSQEEALQTLRALPSEATTTRDKLKAALRLLGSK
jgi:holliday junction DNA helicase RuvA